MSESLPQDLRSLFGPVVLEIDQAMANVQTSQRELSQEMDKLMEGDDKKIKKRNVKLKKVHRIRSILRHHRTTQTSTLFRKIDGF